MRNQQALEQLLEVQERKLTLLAYDIHDGLCQKLAAALCHLNAFRRLRSDPSEEAHRSFELAIRLLSEAMAEARRLIAGLQPSEFESLDVSGVVEHVLHENRTCGGPLVEFRPEVQHEELSAELKNAVFRIVQEALCNARRHSRSRKARVDLTRREGFLCIRVEDWGRGFDPATVGRSHFGLRGIRARAAILGGQATIDSIPGRGTRITVRLPLAEQPVHQEC